MDSMYRGKRKFDREQLVFVVETILCSARDRLLSGVLPDDISYEDLPEEYKGGSLGDHGESVLETAGMSLAIFAAQLINDGVEPWYALEAAARYDETLNNFFADVWKDKGKKVQDRAKRLRKKSENNGYNIRELYPNYPDERYAAEQFVNTVFDRGGGAKDLYVNI